MAEEMNRKDAAQEKLTDRNYVYVRYENDDDDEMDIYDIITLCKKGLLIAKRYIALLLVFFAYRIFRVWKPSKRKLAKLEAKAAAKANKA